MDTSINAINSIGANDGAQPQKTENKDKDKDNDKMKELVENNKFEKFDIDKDGKISGVEALKLKMIFHSVSFDKDDDDAIDESSFNKALSDFK